MKKIPISKLILVFALFAISLYDISVAVKTIMNNNTGSGILILVLGIFLIYTGIKTLIRNIKEYK